MYIYNYSKSRCVPDEGSVNVLVGAPVHEVVNNMIRITSVQMNNIIAIIISIDIITNSSSSRS